MDKNCSIRNGTIEMTEDFLPNFDEDRVYISDIKKVIQWYNALQSAGLIQLPKQEAAEKVS